MIFGPDRSELPTTWTLHSQSSSGGPQRAKVNIVGVDTGFYTEAVLGPTALSISDPCPFCRRMGQNRCNRATGLRQGVLTTWSPVKVNPHFEHLPGGCSKQGRPV